MICWIPLASLNEYTHGPDLLLPVAFWGAKFLHIFAAAECMMESHRHPGDLLGLNLRNVMQYICSRLFPRQVVVD